MKQITLGTILTLFLFVAIECNSNQKKEHDLQATVSLPVEKLSPSNNVYTLSQASGEKVTFITSDGVKIVGTFYSTAKEKSPAVLCLHQWMSDKSAYNSIAQKFLSKGINVLAIDMRGFGESTKKSSGEGIEPNRQAVPDIEAAIKFLENQKSVHPSRIGILGASYGASNAIIYASTHSSIKAVTLLSPGLNYFNVLPTEPAVKMYSGRPLMGIASDEDLRSVEAVKKYQAIVQNNYTLKLTDNLGHGTNMLKANSDLEDEVVNFFVKNL